MNFIRHQILLLPHDESSRLVLLDAWLFLESDLRFQACRDPWEAMTSEWYFLVFFWSCLLLSFPFGSLAAFYWVSSFFLFMPDAICYSFVFCPAHLPGSAMTLGSLFCCIAFSAGMEVGEGSGKVSMIFLRALAFLCSVHWLVWCNVWIFVFVPFVCCLTRTEGSRCANGIRVMDLHTTWGLIVRALESCFLCWRPSGALVAFEHRNWFFKLILTIWWSVWVKYPLIWYEGWLC